MTLTGPPRVRLRDHRQWRPDWTAGRVSLLWYLTFEDQNPLRAWQDAARTLLQPSPSLAVVPTAWLHLTVTDLGFVEDLSPAEVASVVAAARAELDGFGLPELRLGPATTMDDSLVLEAAPAADLERLTALLRTAGARVLGDRAHDGVGGSAPHVTVGYVSGECDQHELLDHLGAAADDVVAARATAVVLAAVTRHEQHYEWTVTERVLLAATD
jgi:2'-5' RNA ligase